MAAMQSEPYEVSRRDGIVTLTLDTPGSEVNILSNQAADQVLDVLSGIRPGTDRAVVFGSAKEASFINGVGLMMAIAARSPESAQALTSRVRAAYEAVRVCPVPTIATIRGNCYGCGVEFSLCCDHRLAADTVSTHFYMTELNDYLFNPVFEGTLRLPLLLGLGAAADLLLWGQRWSAQKAMARGLVEQVVNHQSFNADVARFVEAATAAGRAESAPIQSEGGLSSEDELVVHKNLDRIGRLPPAYQSVYRDCFGLMVHVKKQGRVTEVAKQIELQLAGTSSCRRKAKNAFSFFFIRQMAKQIAQGSKPHKPRPQVISFDPQSESLKGLWADLTSRPLPDVDVVATVVQDGVDSRQPIFYLTDSQSKPPDLMASESVIPVGVQLACLGRPPEAGTPVLLHGPGYPSGPQLFELAMANGNPGPARDLYQTLTRAGYEVILTQPNGDFVLDLWLRAYLRPLLGYCQACGHTADVNASLRRFGFVRRPHVVIEPHSSKDLELLLGVSPSTSNERDVEVLETLREPSFERGCFDRRVVDSLLISLLATASACLDEGSLLHPSQADLIAREAFDFPLRYGSLCRFMTPRRVAAIMERESSFGDLLSAEALGVASKFVERGKSFYL